MEKENNNCKSVLLNVWVKKDNSSELFTYGDDFKKLNERVGDFPFLEGQIHQYLKDGKDRNPGDRFYYRFRMGLHYTDEIKNMNLSPDFFQGKIGDRSNGNVDAEFTPIIHILQSDYGVTFLEGEKCQDKYKDAPRYRFIIDSGIWNYLATNTDEFKADVKEIVSNWGAGYYNLVVAREYAELNSRLSRNSYLYTYKADGGENGDKGHGANVVPFVFHSEHLIRKWIEDDFVKIPEGETLSVIGQIKNQKWRILLVDDKAKEKMSNVPIDPEPGGVNDLPWNCKLAIIERNIYRVFGEGNIGHRSFVESGKCDCNILIEYAQTLDEAKMALKEKKYDLIFLDYLLDKTTDKQNYGYSLLNDLYREREEKGEFKEFKLGPAGRFFFMFISAYSTAVYERTRAEAINLSEDYWHISLGACPTNTPQLFLYNLLKLMEKRLKDSGLLNLSAQGIGKLMSDIYHDASGGNAVRRKANKQYEKVLSLHYHYRKVMKDVAIPMSDSVFDSKGSVLMTDFAQKNQNLGGLLEHMANLVHITAFGTIRQWPEMWEEYLYFKALYEQMPGEKMEGLFDDIEKYILQLKQGQG